MSYIQEGNKMIRVIASDLDDTLLGSNHVISEVNVAAIKKAQEAGIRFIVATGRGQKQADDVVKPAGLRCECLLSSGAQINDADGNVLVSNALSYEEIKLADLATKPDNVPMFFFAEGGNYVVGTEEQMEELLIEDVRMFYYTGTDEEIRQSDFYKNERAALHCLEKIEDFEEKGITVYKAFAFAKDLDRVDRTKERLNQIPSLITASAFRNSIEVTNIRAQKGPVLKDFLEAQGYTMDEIMILGDSPNDRSMFDMDFGATVAVANGYDEIKEIAHYITKSNDENGVAYAIEKVLEGRLEDLKK